MYPSRRLLAALAVVAMPAATPAVAERTVARVSQPTRHALDGGSRCRLPAGVDVRNHAWIRTGRTGGLLLRQGDDTIPFRPNTVAAGSRRYEGGVEMATIPEMFGSIPVDVEPHPRRSDEVGTPYLAVLVEGTRSGIDVDRTSAERRVHQGVVEATRLALCRRANVRTGQAALARANRRFAVRGSARPARIVPVEPREPRVTPATAAREPVQMSVPSSGSDSGHGAEARAERRGRLVEAARAREKGKGKRCRREEAEPDRPVKEDDAPDDDDPDVGNVPEKPPKGGEVEGPDGSPSAGDGDETPDPSVGDGEEQALAPILKAAGSPRQG